MDQSKAQDLQLRLTALNLAIQNNASPNGFPDETVEDARMIYLFLVAKDPLVDLGITEAEDSNVIVLSEYRKTMVEDFDDA